MSDTNELRALVIYLPDDDCKPFMDAIDRLEAAESEALEEARLNGMGSEREAALMAKLEAAEKENKVLREALAEKVTSETMLRDLSVGNGSIHASFEGGAVHLLVDALAGQFSESGAENYLEMHFHSPATGPLVATLQRVNGKTPHQLREAAEKERDALRAKVNEMERQEPVAEIGQQYTLLFAGSGSITGVVKRHGLKIGDKLYALPGAQPAPSIPADVMRDAKRYRFLRAAKNIPISTEAARDPVVYDAAIDAAMLARAPEAKP